MISALKEQKSDLEGELRYLVLVLEPNKNQSNSFVGFIGDGFPLCVQWFDGTQDDGFVQLPKVFNSKKDAEVAIKKSKKDDKAFKQKHVYMPVPMDIV